MQPWAHAAEQAGRHRGPGAGCAACNGRTAASLGAAPAPRLRSRLWLAHVRIEGAARGAAGGPETQVAGVIALDPVVDRSHPGYAGEVCVSDPGRRPRSRGAEEQSRGVWLSMWLSFEGLGLSIWLETLVLGAAARMMHEAQALRVLRVLHVRSNGQGVDGRGREVGAAWLTRRGGDGVVSGSCDGAQALLRAQGPAPPRRRLGALPPCARRGAVWPPPASPALAPPFGLCCWGLGRGRHRVGDWRPAALLLGVGVLCASRPRSRGHGASSFRRRVSSSKPSASTSDRASPLSKPARPHGRWTFSSSACPPPRQPSLRQTRRLVRLLFLDKAQAQSRERHSRVQGTRRPPLTHMLPRDALIVAGLEARGVFRRPGAGGAGVGGWGGGEGGRMFDPNILGSGSGSGQPPSPVDVHRLPGPNEIFDFWLIGIPGKRCV